ncbi:hypothetical protein CDD80_2329 [Ophiocordyceps camponoti-rufipedis]|uniref:DUF676 domain-containing protein n=1 Tax=Ophiocordyceps camponoti-rufipedis TaxID=2004952 RepID=A0A2C5Z109_9HYPO|nr:hypothetical protein CDD80_2329 [Ophiocordyceps camponoti-rufipedis]
MPTAEQDEDYMGGSHEADHLCVLVHGLWGNPGHMKSMAKALRSQYPRDRLCLLIAKRNSGSFTYDGIELGGERVCAEIEEELQNRAGKIKKLSVVGYSLGGLVSRYAVGLLYAKGLLEHIECMNFATFATPHLGVRSPTKGWHNYIWNYVGARSLSMSGRQLFAIDKFRDTGRPLLSVLADPASIFMRGISKFKRRTLYANVVNDRSAVYYTTSIRKTDPFRNLDKIEPNYVQGYGSVIMDPKVPFKLRPESSASLSSATSTALQWAKRLPLILMIAVVVPAGTVAFLCNSVIQTVKSSGRIRQHEAGQANVNVEEYRVPVLLKEMRGEMEKAYGALNSSQNQDFLTAEDESVDDEMGAEERQVMNRERKQSMTAQPTLALTAHQFQMIRALDELRWRKFPVWIHNDQHSHAAMIVRFAKKSFDEGFLVLRHFSRDEFVL